MRVTTSFPLGTLRDTPSEAEIISHQLLLKAGYIRRVNSLSRGLGDVYKRQEELVGIDEVQKFLNRSRASVYRYTNTDLRNLNPSFNPRKLNPEFRTDQKDPLKFHPNEVARFAKDILRIKEVTVEVFNTPSSAAQNILAQILDELKSIRSLLEKE